MGRTCLVCSHPDRAAIDVALVDGEAYRTIAKRFAISPGSVFRHRSDHLPGHLVAAKEAGRIDAADDLLAQIARLQDEAKELRSLARKKGDYRTAMAGINTALRCIDLYGELRGELDRRPVVNITMTAEWLRVEGIIVAALTAWPGAALAVAAALNPDKGAHDHVDR